MTRRRLLYKVDKVPFIGCAIFNALQSGESTESIINQIRQMNEDNSEAVQRLYGDYYPQLLEILKEP